MYKVYIGIKSDQSLLGVQSNDELLGRNRHALLSQNEANDLVPVTTGEAKPEDPVTASGIC